MFNSLVPTIGGVLLPDYNDDDGEVNELEVAMRRIAILEATIAARGAGPA